MVGMRLPVPGWGWSTYPHLPGEKHAARARKSLTGHNGPQQPGLGPPLPTPRAPRPRAPTSAQPRTRSRGPSLVQDRQGSGLAVPLPGQGLCQSCRQPQPPADSLPGLRPAWRSLGCIWPWLPSLGLSLALEPTSSLLTCPWPGLLAGPGCPPGMLGSGTGLPVAALPAGHGAAGLTARHLVLLEPLEV